MSVGAENRILFIAPEPFYEERGTPIAILHVLQAYRDLGFQIDVVTYPIGSDVELRGVRVFRAANPLRIRRIEIGFSAHKLLLDVTLVVEVVRALRRERYTFIHAVEEAAFPVTWLRHMHRLPVVYDMQSSLAEGMGELPFFRLAPMRSVLNAMERWLLRRVSVVVCSVGLRERVARVAPETRVQEWIFPAAAISISPERISALRDRFGIERDARVVLYSGNLEAYQGVSELLEAMPALIRECPDAVLVLLGAEGEPKDRFHQRAVALGIGHAVRLVARQPREEVPAYLAMADVLVSPRIRGENVPLKVFEYLSAGRPIVATDIPAHRMLLGSGRAALVPPRAADLSRAIAQVLKSSESAQSMVDAASSYARQQLEWPEFLGTVEHLEAMARGRG